MPKYRVSGPFPFRGNSPNSTFEADADEQIERAVSRGSISAESDKPVATSGDVAATPPQTPTPPATTLAPSAPSPKGGQTK